MGNRKTIIDDQRGLVSILVTMIIMIVLSLIVIGFAQLVRREQRQTLDRQLSAQAFYAAEAGINDAGNAIKSQIAAGSFNFTTEYANDCGAAITALGLDNELDGPGGVITYSCLLIDPTPTSLEYTNIDRDESTVVQIQEESQAAINSIKIGWEDRSGGNDFTDCPASPDFPVDWDKNLSNDKSCDTGILRVDLVPFPIAGIQNRDSLQNGMMTAFLYPTTAGGTATATYGNMIGQTGQGAIVAVTCTPNPPSSQPRQCELTIDGLGQNNYYLRMKSIYRASAVTVRAFNSVGNQVELRQGQVSIDATGKANDVLRRVQVRYPLSTFADEIFPDYAIQTYDSICKRLDIIPNHPTNPVEVAPYVNTACDPQQP